MNERIHDLAMLARKHFPKTETSGEFWVLDEEKFAELIVQECVGVVDSMADPEDSERYFWAIQNASKKIKQHFGVK